MMKVLIISDYNAPYGGNFIESLKKLNEKININKYECYYLFPKRVFDKEWINELERLSHQKVYFFRNNTMVNCYSNIVKIIKENNIDIVYCHFCRHKTQIAIKLSRLFNRKIKLVSHFHNHCKDSKNILKKMIIRFGYWFYEGDLNIGCSESVMMSMPYNKKICTFVENGIDFSRLDKKKNIEFKKNKNDFIILMFGFDYYRKGIDIAIKAINDLNNKNIKLVISLASNKDKVEKYILNEYNKIPEFLMFLDPIDEVGSYYDMCDIFLSAAREEGFCYSIVEAAYCKTNIISSNIGGVPKNIQGELIFKSGNIEDLKQQILLLMNHENNELDRAKNYVKIKYGVEAWANDIYTILFNLK